MSADSRRYPARRGKAGLERYGRPMGILCRGARPKEVGPTRGRMTSCLPTPARGSGHRELFGRGAGLTRRWLSDLPGEPSGAPAGLAAFRRGRRGGRPGRGDGAFRGFWAGSRVCPIILVGNGLPGQRLRATCCLVGAAPHPERPRRPAYFTNPDGRLPWVFKATLTFAAERSRA